MEKVTKHKYVRIKLTILTSDNVDFKAKRITKTLEKFFRMIKHIIHQEDIITLNL